VCFCTTITFGQGLTMGINDPSGSIHDHLSQKRMAVQNAALKETAKKPHKSRGEAVRKALHRDVVGGMRGVRKVGTPLTVAWGWGGTQL
jgi:hypothetical protein